MENLQLQEVAQQPARRGTEYQITMATQPDWEIETMAASQANPRVQVRVEGEKSAEFGIGLNPNVPQRGRLTGVLGLKGLRERSEQ